MPTKTQFVLCVSNEGCEDLERRKLYAVVADERAAAEGYLRVVDESGEDYLYPAQNFAPIELPADVLHALEAV
jgi:hypothetical protein